MDPDDFEDALHDLRGEAEGWGQAYRGHGSESDIERCAAEASRLEAELLAAYRSLWKQVHPEKSPA